MKTILILGGGWGGLATAHALRGMLPADYRIAIIEKRESFVFYPSYLKAITGEITDNHYLKSPYRDLIRKDLEIINEEIIKINPEEKTVTTTTQTIQADFIIIATGAALYPENIPGFNENCLNLNDTKGAFAIHEKLKTFSKGKIAFLVARTPFRCPPAPYEAAMLTDWFVRQKGNREDIEISVYTPEKLPMPSGGEQVGKEFLQILESHHILFNGESSVSKIEQHRIHFTNGKEAEYDLLIGVPPHGAPKFVTDAGLTDGSGYIPSHPQTMEILDNVEELTIRFEGVYAIGDVAGIQLLNGKYLPKGGVFAEEQAHAVARNITSIIKGEKSTAGFNGKGSCFVDVGDGMAAEGVGDFYAYPDPVVKLEPPTLDGRKAKHEFERIFEWWFSEYQNKK